MQWKDPSERDKLYEQLGSEIKRLPNKEFLIILCDFNAKTGSGHNEFPEQIAKYGKGFMNSSGRLLLETCLQYELVLSNTLFSHRLSHRTTWTAPYREYITHDGTYRRNPIRNQIDYILIKKQHINSLKNSRSYGGILTDTDHKLVIANFQIKTKNQHKKATKKEPKINFSEFSKKENQIKYRNSLKLIRYTKNLTPQEKWTQIVETHKNVAKDILGVKKYNNISADPEIKRIALKKQKIKLEIDSCQSDIKYVQLKEQHKVLKKELRTKNKTQNRRRK